MSHCPYLFLPTETALPSLRRSTVWRLPAETIARIKANLIWKYVRLGDQHPAMYTTNDTTMLVFFRGVHLPKPGLWGFISRWKRLITYCNWAIVWVLGHLYSHHG
jgi:hypothetical protein